MAGCQWPFPASPEPATASLPDEEAAAANGTVLLEGAALVGGDATSVLIEGDTIAALGRDAVGAGRRLDLGGLVLAPGFVELQVNGAAGHDVTREPESIWAVGESLAQFGVTSFLPTIVTSPPGVVAAARAVLAAGAPPGYHGAIPLGLHVEGPFLNPERRGAHDAAHLRPPDPALVTGWSPVSGIRLVTLAPELPGALEIVRSLVGAGIVVSAGHSLATAAEASAGFDAGIRYVTHLFNAMPPLDHREPGLAGAALADSRVTVGLIPDGIHVHPTIIDLAWRLAGPDRFSIVTDAMAGLGMSPGTYQLGDTDVVVEDAARLRDGRLAGSVVGLDRAVRNVAGFTGASVEEVVAAVTSTPARLLGLPDRGTIAVGGRADLVVLTPELEVVATIVGGRIVHTVDDRWA